MAHSSILITFTEIPSVNEAISFSEDLLGINFLEVFKSSRLAPNQTRLPIYKPSLDTYNGYVSENYKHAISLDINNILGELFTIQWTNGEVGSGIGTVRITANYPNAVFVEDVNTTSATIEIFNQSTVPAFNFVETSFTTASSGNEQNYCKVNVETNHLATNILEPVSYTGNSANPFLFDWLRGQIINIKVQDSNGIIINKSVKTPDYLNASNFTINVNNSPNGATVTVTNVNSEGLELQYSLDGENWQTENTFPGLDIGDFTMFIKDQLGWEISIDFSVSEFGIYSPYFYISKANSFRFANRITFGDSENYKTDENTLSCEVDVPLPTKAIQKFQSADVITTQFNSNFAINTVKIVKSDDSEIDVPVNKMSNNIGIKDKRDAIKYNIGNGRTGVYFLAGNIYDYDTNAVSSTHALNGAIPEWAQIGNYIQIGSAWFLIEEIVYDENKSADVLVFTDLYTGPEIPIIAASIFNRFNYEVYEFTIDMVDYIDQKFRVRINNTDPHFTEIIHLSELIWCKVKHEKVLEINYWNLTNTDIMYSTGIQHKIRIPYIARKGKSDGSSEVNKTDTDTILLSADLYEVDEIIFEPLTKEIWRKLMQALSHENVLINGVGYVKNGDFNNEGPLGDTDDYVLTATMIKTGNVYNSQTSGNLDFNGSSVEVPGLISTESGYVKY